MVKRLKKRRRGFRKFFTPPKKGCRNYGVRKGTRLPVGSYTAGKDVKNALMGFADEVQSNAQVHAPAPDSMPAGMHERPGLRCLSLCDGASGAFCALAGLGLYVEAYYTSEADCTAISIQKKNVPFAINLSADVRDITPEVLDSLGTIHLLIGSDGSPVELSVKQEDEDGLHQSTGALSWEFIRILNYLKQKAMSESTVFQWLYESSIICLDNHTLKEMNSAFGHAPTLRCLSEYLPCKRERFYWGSLSTLTGPLERNPIRTALTLQDFLDPFYTATSDIMTTLNEEAQKSSGGRLPVVYNGKDQFLPVTAQEGILGFPRYWSDTGLASITERRTVLNKSFGVPVVQALLEPLIDQFKQAPVPAPWMQK